MGVRITALECGWLRGDYSAIVPGRSGEVRIPVPSFLLEHRQGTVLFDLGMHASLTDSADRIGRIAKALRVELPPHLQLTAQLLAAGKAPSAISHAVASHLHFDHVGGLAEVPNATLIIQEEEWKAATAGEGPVAGGYVRDDFDLGHVRKLVDGTFDLFGDGALVIHPTPGHTAGHQSLLVEGRVLLTGDACTCQLALDADAVPDTSHTHDPRLHRKTFSWLRRLQADGVALVFSHDPVQWAKIATGRLPWPSNATGSDATSSLAD